MYLMLSKKVSFSLALSTRSTFQQRGFISKAIDNLKGFLSNKPKTEILSKEKQREREMDKVFDIFTPTAGGILKFLVKKTGLNVIMEKAFDDANIVAQEMKNMETLALNILNSNNNALSTLGNEIRSVKYRSVQVSRSNKRLLLTLEVDIQGLSNKGVAEIIGSKDDSHPIFVDKITVLDRTGGEVFFTVNGNYIANNNSLSENQNKVIDIKPRDS